MPTKKRQDRISRILQTLSETRGTSVRELSRLLQVSEMTIRRDLELLSGDSKVRLLHAAALPADSAPAGSARGQSSAEKVRIGQKAASLIEAGDIVVVDAGSTTEVLTRAIPAELPVTILCFALNILQEAVRGTARSVVFAGGELRGNSLVFASPEGISLLRRYRATKAFLSAGAVSTRLGVTCTDPGEAELKKVVMGCSQTRILLADSRKFGGVKPSWFADLSDFDAVVTDSGIALEYVEILRELGIALHVV
jgi:DeoR family deoxyribose operon repressor